MPETTDRYTATRLSAELGLDNRKMWDILTRVNPVQIKGRSKLVARGDPPRCQVPGRTGRHRAIRRLAVWPAQATASSTTSFSRSIHYQASAWSVPSPGSFAPRLICPAALRQAMPSRSTAPPIRSRYSARRDGRHHAGLGEGLAAGFDLASIAPHLTASLSSYIPADSRQGLDIFIHLCLGIKLGDQHTRVLTGLN